MIGAASFLARAVKPGSGAAIAPVFHQRARKSSRIGVKAVSYTHLGSSLFVDQNYHGNALENRKNVVYVRPVAVWQSGAWSAAAAIESNLVNNAYGYQNPVSYTHLDVYKRQPMPTILSYPTTATSCGMRNPWPSSV